MSTTKGHRYSRGYARVAAAGLLAAATLPVQALGLGDGGLLAGAGIDLDIGVGIEAGAAGDGLGPALPRQGEGKTAAQAAREARERYGGRVLSVSKSGNGYRVKLLEDGNVRVVTIPAR